MSVQSIEYLNEKLSAEIFKALTSGQIINRNLYIDGIHEFNPLYIELAENEKMYRAIHKCNGYILKDGKDYYYLSPINESASDELRVKITTTIIVLFRYVGHEKGYGLSYLTKDCYGISKEDIEELNESSFMKFMKGAEMKNFDNALKLLKDRGIVYLNKKGNYVLTDAGCSFFEDYIKSETPFSLD